MRLQRKSSGAATLWYYCTYGGVRSYKDEISGVGLALLQTAVWVCHFLCQVDPLRTVYRGFRCIRRSAGISHGLYGFRRIDGCGDRLPKLKVADSRPVARFLESQSPLVVTVLTEADLQPAKPKPARFIPSTRIELDAKRGGPFRFLTRTPLPPSMIAFQQPMAAHSDAGWLPLQAAACRI